MINEEQINKIPRVRSQPIRTLNEQSEIKSFSLDDINWDVNLDENKKWIPEGAVIVAHLDSFHKLPSHLQLRYNQLASLSICEQFIWFESHLLIPILQRYVNLKIFDVEFKKCIMHFIQEEEKHSEMFWRTLELSNPEYINNRQFQFVKLNPFQQRYFQFLVKKPEIFLVWLWMAIYFEERTMHFSKLYKEAQGTGIEQHFQHIHALHMIDESRHLQIDQYLLRDFYNNEPKWKKRLAAKMFCQILEIYTKPKRIAKKIFSILVDEEPSCKNIVDQILKEGQNCQRNQKYMDDLFGDKAIPRTRELLKAYPEMAQAFSLINIH